MSTVPPEGARDDNARNTMQELAAYIEDKIPQGWGFFLMTFPHELRPGRMNYVSKSQREDVIRLMKEFILKTEKGSDLYKHHDY